MYAAYQWSFVSLVEAGHVSLPASECLCVVPVSLCLWGGVPVCPCVLPCVHLRVVAVSVCICRREARPCLPALLSVCLCGFVHVCVWVSVCVCVCVCVFQDPRGLVKAKLELLGRRRRQHMLLGQELIDLLDTINPP